MAYLLALFVPGARFGVIGVALVFYFAIISLSVALPMVTQIKKRAEAAAAKSRHRMELRAQNAADSTDEDETSANTRSASPSGR